MDEYGLAQLQKRMIEIILHVDEICRRNSIHYYLTGGCALGAIRHKGFIPWDDDLDIFMTSENYYRFLKICEEQLDRDRFYLQRENTGEWPSLYTKIRMNGTTYYESYNQNLKMHKGILLIFFA